MTSSASAPVVARGRPDGSYRRRIRMRALAPDTTEAALEDDFHRFTVTVRHDTTNVTAISAASGRWPWTTCPDAGAQLEQLVGMALSPRCTAVATIADPRWQCTHQFDLAGLAVAHTARGGRERRYDIEVPPLAPDGASTPRLRRDGELLLEWQIDAGTGLVAPSPFTDGPWRGGFIKWADRTLDPDRAEAAIVLRRACEIAMGRGMDLEGYRNAGELADLMSGVCYTMQPDVMPGALRMIGSIRDFADHPDALLAESDGDSPRGDDSLRPSIDD